MKNKEYETPYMIRIGREVKEGKNINISQPLPHEITLYKCDNGDSWDVYFDNTHCGTLKSEPTGKLIVESFNSL